MAAAADLLPSLLRFSRELSHPPPHSTPLPLARHLSSLSRRANLLSLLFADLLAANAAALPTSAVLCLHELLLLLHRFKSLLADLSSWTRLRLALNHDLLPSLLHDLYLDLSTLLDILPLPDLPLSPDVRDLASLLSTQCRRRPSVTDDDIRIRTDLLCLIRDLELGLVPDTPKLRQLFDELGLVDARSCAAEIEALEREIADGGCEKLSPALIALAGLLRYAKCVLFGVGVEVGVSAPQPETESGSGSAVDLAVPADFRCPISLELMRDPVVAASGQTYDRDSIARWIAAGHATCPKTGQALAHSDLIPNKALKNLIALWRREQSLPPLDRTESGGNGEVNAVGGNKAATEAARMTASFLVEQLAASSVSAEASRVVQELRQLSKTGSEIRAFVGEAGAVPLLIPLLSSADASLEVNAVTALLNLSLVEANKKRIMHADGAVEGVTHVLAEGATWQAKENAAATVASLSAVHSYRRRLGRNVALTGELVGLARAGPAGAKRDALAALLCLAGERENIRRLIDAGVIEAALESVGAAEVADEAVGILAAVTKRGGALEVGTREGVVPKLVRVLKNGSDSGREHAAAALVILCRKVGGSEMVGGLVRMPGIEWVIWELMGSGTERGRRKAAALGRICRRWVATAEEVGRAARFAAAVSVTASPVAQA